MHKVNVYSNLLQERKKTITRLIESFVREMLKENLAPQDVSKTLNKYLSKVQDQAGRQDFMMQAAQFLGRKANVNPEELDLALRQHYAKNYDPAKLARGQTPTQRASQQATKDPPSIPQQAPRGKEPEMPSLKSLAAQETDPIWKKHNLPSPDELEKSRLGQASSAKSSSSDEDLPLADPDDVEDSETSQKTTSKKRKEVDIEKIGTKEPKEKPAKSDASSGKNKDKKKTATKSGKLDIPMPSFGSVLRSQMQSQNAQSGLPKWKIGSTVDVGNSKGYKVTGKTANFYNLEKNGEKYVFRPFKGLKKVS